MKFFPGSAATAVSRPVFPQLPDQQLAHGVVQIARIISAARGLLDSGTLRLETFLHEKTFRILHRPALRMQTDGREKACVPQQGVTELTDTGFRVSTAQSGFQHHLFGVMGPALAKGVADKSAPKDPGGAVGMQKIQKMTRPDLVHRSKQQVGLTRDIVRLHVFRPLRVGW